MVFSKRRRKLRSDMDPSRAWFMTAQPVLLDDLTLLREKLLRFAALTKADIREIWIRPGEPEQIDDLVYDWKLPLFAKMIFRFQNAGNNPSLLYNGVDPGNRQRLLAKFQLGRYGHLIDFFTWLTTSVSLHDILLLEGVDFGHYRQLKADNGSAEVKYKTEYEKRWKENPITFFFWLPLDKQQQLVNDYQSMMDSFKVRIEKDDEIRYK